jgi:hypothetical protein
MFRWLGVESFQSTKHQRSGKPHVFIKIRLVPGKPPLRLSVVANGHERSDQIRSAGRAHFEIRDKSQNQCAGWGGEDKGKCSSENCRIDEWVTGFHSL